MVFAMNSTEYVCEIPNSEQREILQQHFNLWYRMLAENKLIHNASFEKTKGVYRCLSGILMPFNNAVIGSISPEYNWDEAITEQLEYFGNARMPFVWYVDETEPQEFKDKLTERGFKDVGIFQGVMGRLNAPLPISEAPKDCVLELVRDEQGMDEFNELVCATFAMTGEAKEFYKKVLWNAAQGDEPIMFHWMAKKEGKVVAAVSTLIEGDLVSFWNGATLSEFRRHGFSTALRHLALNDAISRGCCIGSSYLMADGLAFGICKKLGYQTKWRFSAFVSPSKLMQ
jgi:hypothetical protein